MPPFINQPKTLIPLQRNINLSGAGGLFGNYHARQKQAELDQNAAQILEQSQYGQPVVNAFKAGDRGLGAVLMQAQQRKEERNIPRQVAPTALMQNLAAAGLTPGTPEYRDAILNGSKRGMVINNQMPGAEKGTNKLTEKLAEQAAGVFDQSNAAQDLASKYGQINDLANNPNVRTGTLGNLELGVKKLGNTVFGLEFEGLPEGEQIQKVGALIVGDIRKLQGDTRMSDADRRAYAAIPPNLGDSKQGISLATTIMQKTANGMGKRQDYLSELVARNGGNFDTRVWAEYNKYVRANPLITNDDLSKARAIAGQVKQNLPGAGMEVFIEKYGINPNVR